MNENKSPGMQPKIDEDLVSRLIASQFPLWKALSVRGVAQSGWDNRTFHLGSELLVRLPSQQIYASQVEKEHRWLPVLARLLPLSIPDPIAKGEPGNGYPWRWSIYRWLPGEAASTAAISDMNDFAKSLGQFLTALHRIDTTGGPPPGPHSFDRGGSLSTYDAQTRQAIALLQHKIDTDAATKLWEAALATCWEGSPVWVHGDMSAGNLLVNDGRLSAVIDFGQLTVGDPACDLAIAWTFFNAESRAIFRQTLPLDPGTWTRGRAWTLWKALIIAAGITETNALQADQSLRIIETVLREF